MSGTDSARTETIRIVLAALLAAVIALGVLAASGCSNTAQDVTSDESAATQGATAQNGASDAGADAASDAQMTVTVNVDSSAADGSVSFDGTVELDAGATAYDALVATGLELDASDSQYGMYVAGIGGLAGGDYGDMSGWLYDVNGEAALVGCDSYELADGDTVNWTYSTGE